MYYVNNVDYILCLHQQNPPVLDWRFQLMQVELYNRRKKDGSNWEKSR